MRASTGAKDGVDLPLSQAVWRTAPQLTGPGEIADFEFPPQAPGDLVLDVDSPFAACPFWVAVRIRPASSRPRPRGSGTH